MTKRAINADKIAAYICGNRNAEKAGENTAHNRLYNGRIIVYSDGYCTDFRRASISSCFCVPSLVAYHLTDGTLIYAAEIVANIEGFYMGQQAAANQHYHLLLLSVMEARAY